MSYTAPVIPWTIDDLFAEDGRIDTLKKPGQDDFSRQATAADKKIWADLANRQKPIRPGDVADFSQLTPLKVYWMMHLIYQSGITAKADRNAYLADDHEARYNSNLAALHIETGDGARVQVRRKLVRC